MVRKVVEMNHVFTELDFFTCTMVKMGWCCMCAKLMKRYEKYISRVCILLQQSLAVLFHLPVKFIGKVNPLLSERITEKYLDKNKFIVDHFSSVERNMPIKNIV